MSSQCSMRLSRGCRYAYLHGGTFRHAVHRWIVRCCEVVDITSAEPWIEPTLSIPRVSPLSLARASYTPPEELRKLGGIAALSSGNNNLEQLWR